MDRLIDKKDYDKLTDTQKIDYLEKTLKDYREAYINQVLEIGELKRQTEENILLRLVRLVNDTITDNKNDPDIIIKYKLDGRKLSTIFEDDIHHYLNIITEDEDGTEHLDAMNEQYFFYQLFNGKVIEVIDNSWVKC